MILSLHWLRVSERIDYKIAVLTYRVLHGGMPPHLGPLTSVVELPSRRVLRSAVTNRLVVPSVRLVNCRQPPRLPPPGSGILYWSTSSRQQHCSPSRNTWKRSYCNDRTH